MGDKCGTCPVAVRRTTPPLVATQWVFGAVEGINRLHALHQTILCVHLFFQNMNKRSGRPKDMAFAIYGKKKAGFSLCYNQPDERNST